MVYGSPDPAFSISSKLDRFLVVVTVRTKGKAEGRKSEYGPREFSGCPWLLILLKTSVVLAEPLEKQAILDPSLWKSSGPSRGGAVELWGWPWERRCYLSRAVAPESLEVLSMCQVIGKTAVLKRDSGVNESGSSTVVVHEKRLQIDQ